MKPLSLVLVLSSVFFGIFLVLSGVLYLARGPSATTSATPAVALFSSGAVGVLELNGVIMDSKKMLKKLERFEEDDQIKAIVLRLNSPGGSVAPSQEIYEAVKSYRKPIVVSMASVAASGAYYIACGAKKVFANPGTITGSIGVIMEFANLQKLYEWAKIKRYVIKTGKFKDAGAEHREMTDEERGLLQGMVDDVLTQFKQAVATGRNLKMDQVTKVADGRIFSGAQAKRAGLVDELGTLEDAVNEAAKQAGIKGKPRVVYPDRQRKRLIDALLDDGERDESAETDVRVGGLLSTLVSRLVGPLPTSQLPDLTPGIYWLWTGSR